MMAVDQIQINRDLLVSSEISTEPEAVEGSNKASGYCFSGSSDSGSEYFSSVEESEVGSAKSSEEEEEEAEEEEDDYIAELTRKMAQYTFQDDEIHDKSWGVPISPQSTLWLPPGWNQEISSSSSSPCSTGKSRETSPPATPLIKDFEKMKINEEIPKFKPFTSPTPIPSTTRNSEIRIPSKESLIDEQIRAIQKLKQEQSMKLTNQNQRINQKGRLPFYPSRHYGSSEFRAVFLNKPGSKTGSTGTGVFLPQNSGTSSQTRKKKGCSTVLIPTRVVHALKLHFEKTGVPSRLDSTMIPLKPDVVRWKNESLGQKRRPQTPQTAPQDLGLPQEWTY